MGYQKKYKKFVATAATATLVASAIVPVASAKSFSDVAENNEFQPFIDALSDAGIINGYQDGTFKPGNKLTRGQVVKMLGRWVEANGQEIPADWNSVQRFNDVPTNSADQELVKYAALVKDAGVFTGSNGNLLANNNITRQQMAKVLNGAYTAINGFSLVDLADSIDNKLVTDLASAQQEFEGYIQALVDLEISTVSVFRPTENVTRAQFAKFLYNTINLEVVEAEAVGVKAINNTTVEVTFEDGIDNIKDIDFAIEGLKVENAVVKQTAKNVAVLTTSAQEAGKEYTVTVDGEKVGSFKGIAAVIPTKITTTTTSLQGVIGEQVTVKAQVAVAEGQSKENVPVTFNVVNSSTNNNKIEVEVLTNAEGVATYSYTRYYGSEDTVTAYATKKSSIYDTAKVYWANKIQLAVSEITTGNELTNETKKSYKVTGEKNKTYYVAIKENLNVAPDKVTQVKVQHQGILNFVTPYELTTGGTEFAKVTTDASGEATFTVFGTNLSATPIVYAPETTPVPGTVTGVETEKYNKLDLQAQAPTVKFSQVNALALSVVAEGTAEAAEYAATSSAYNAVSAGGRTYTVTVTDKDGKLAPEGTTAYVTFEENNISGTVYFSTGKGNFTQVTKGNVLPIKVGKEGKATFRVAGTGKTTFVKPTVFLNTAGSTTTPALDKTGIQDIQTVADATYFKSAVVKNAVLTVKDGVGANAKEITSTAVGTDAYVTYQSVDQNGFAYKPTNTNYQLAFDVTSTFGNASVKDVNGAVLNPNQNSQNLGNTRTYQVFSNATGEAVIRVTTTSVDTVSVNVTGANGILPTQAAKVSFTKTSSASVATGVVVSNNTIDKKIVIQNATTGAAYTYSYAAANVAQYKIGGVQVDEDTFKAALTTGDTVTATLATDGKYILNLVDGTEATTIKTQATFNQALANGETVMNVNITSGGLVVDTDAATVVTLTGTVTGPLTIDVPNGDVVLGTATDKFTVNGDIYLNDVKQNTLTFTNASVTGSLNITDDKASVAINGTSSIGGNININGKGKQEITLTGTAANNIVVGSDVDNLTLVTSNTVTGKITAKDSTTEVKQNGSTITPAIETAKGTSGVIELDQAKYAIDERATVTLTDKDLDTNPAVQEKVKVKLTYGTAVSTELELTETTPNSGVFSAYVSADKVGELKVSYTDVKTESSTVEEKKVKATVLAATPVAAASLKAHASDVVLNKAALTGGPASGDKAKIDLLTAATVTNGAITLTTPFDNFTKQDIGDKNTAEQGQVWIGSVIKAPQGATKAVYTVKGAPDKDRTVTQNVGESEFKDSIIQFLPLNVAKQEATEFTAKFEIKWYDAENKLVSFETFNFVYAPATTN